MDSILNWIHFYESENRSVRSATVHYYLHMKSGITRNTNRIFCIHCKKSLLVKSIKQWRMSEDGDIIKTETVIGHTFLGLI